MRCCPASPAGASRCSSKWHSAADGAQRRADPPGASADRRPGRALSPQLFSLIFAVNSARLIALSLIGGRLVGRVGSATLLRRGMFGTFVAWVCTLLVVVSHAGLGWLLMCFFVLLAANGIVLPNGTAAAMGSGQSALGAASALLGLGQFGLGAVVAPLVGLAGSHDAVPMAVVIAVAGTAALTVDLVFVPRGVTPATEVG